jgi:hypothetical protein
MEEPRKSTVRSLYDGITDHGDAQCVRIVGDIGLFLASESIHHRRLILHFQ